MSQTLSSSSPRPEPIGSPEQLGVLRLSRVAGAILVLMPLAIWLANRSTPLLLGLAAATCLVAVLVFGRTEQALARLRALLCDPIGLAVACFLLWALISLAWSHHPRASFAVWGELALPIVFAVVIAASRLFAPSPMLRRLLALSIILASALIVTELASGMSQRVALAVGKQQTFVFNRPVLVCLLLTVPTLHGLLRPPAGTTLDRILALLLVVAVGVAIFRSESEAAKLGLIIVALCWLPSLLLPRFVLAATAAAFVAAMAIAPVLGPVADRVIPKSFHEEIKSANSRARVDIWLSFGDAARARPLIGAGFGTSATMIEHPVFREVAPEHQVLLGAGHAHNMPLQAWAETGAIGAGLLTLAGLLLLWRMRRLPAGELAPRLAVFAAAFVVAAVGHGAWQGWWIAGLGATVLWFGPASAGARRGR